MEGIRLRSIRSAVKFAVDFPVSFIVSLDEEADSLHRYLHVGLEEQP